jgi:hypothetical protein
LQQLSLNGGNMSSIISKVFKSAPKSVPAKRFILSSVGFGVFKMINPHRVNLERTNVDEINKMYLDEITRVGYNISLIPEKLNLTIESKVYEVHGFTRIGDYHCSLLLYSPKNISYNTIWVGPKDASSTSDISYIGTISNSVNIDIPNEFINKLIDSFNMNSENRLMYPVLHFHDIVNGKPMYRKILIKKLKDANTLEGYEVTNPYGVFVKNIVPQYISISDVKNNLDYYDKAYGIISVRKFSGL